jgi:hypothetical protein
MSNELNEAMTRVFHTHECESFLCSARIPLGSGLCLAHAAEARMAATRLVTEIELFLSDHNDRSNRTTGFPFNVR